MPGLLGTYASFLILLGAAALVGQAILIACGRRAWSRLAPAVGLAALCALAWWTVRLPGEGTAAIVAIGLAAALAAAVVFTRVEGLAGALRRGLPLELAAVAIGSLPFLVAGRFGILGTGLNPDMSQHLFAVDRLASGDSERLISGGYPLGPHSLVVAVSSLGPSTVQAFDGLMLAVAVATCLVALGLLESGASTAAHLRAGLRPPRSEAGASTAAHLRAGLRPPRSEALAPWRRIAGALVVGFAYLLASYFTQGAFKETIEALFLLAFAVGLGELAAGWKAADLGDGPRARRALPLAVLAAGAAYAYSFPGVVWLLAALGAWIGLELARAAARGELAGALATAREAAPAALAALGLAVLAIAPELGRMADFASFETFDPAGAGLGNLFNRLSPLEALGIWPSGDFRVEPGGGAVPAFLFYLGAGFGAVALAFGLRWCWRRGPRALVGALAGAALLWLYSLIGGTPYQEAKALLLLAPVVALIAVHGLLASRIPAPIAIAFCLAAGGSGVLALANGPVGPAGYSPALAELRTELPPGSTLVRAPAELLDDQHGLDYLAWELRGNRVCIESADEPSLPTSGEIRTTVSVAIADDGAVVPATVSENESARGPGPCDPIPDTARADPGAGG
jgi:hypothetical protein